ncbi:trans-aconitate 2-methyltransferase [Xylophilus sp.]|uniref:trans-aconitate 2-methyltransferase n=1 Tax=Xylophilus sp. TaxID=2653893 RepID=UPI0013BD7828|nr:trans-aconitate 2-methyltransferase [Xylophilus sp.]KAF1046838.1 MAG: Trans-aconitate 2-methyltransferase [Xylophilus sp.]
MATDWNPALYRRFEGERTRPAQELLARVPLPRADAVVDLGCGPGNSTELLVHRFASAEVVGIDNSEAMIESARERLPQARFGLADISTWAPAGDAPDLVYANASLQWVPDHPTLLPRLFATLAPGGVLAVQMPDNREEPSHQLMREVASEAPFSTFIPDARGVRTAILPLAAYYDLLSTQAAQVDVWHTIYQHPLPSAEAIMDWVRATGLRPFVDRLPPDLQLRFVAEYQRRIDAAYGARAVGLRLLAFPRLFIVAQRKA